jgi:hypothetical protein
MDAGPQMITAVSVGIEQLEEETRRGLLGTCGLRPTLHLQVEDISNERVIVVGKIKQIVGRGESHKLVNTAAMQVMQSLIRQAGTTPPADQQDNEIAGPALELDILAIYR